MRDVAATRLHAFAKGTDSDLRIHFVAILGSAYIFLAGMPGDLIQVCGDWASDAFEKHLEFSMQQVRPCLCKGGVIVGFDYMLVEL